MNQKTSDPEDLYLEEGTSVRPRSAQTQAARTQTSAATTASSSQVNSTAKEAGETSSSGEMAIPEAARTKEITSGSFRTSLPRAERIEAKLQTARALLQNLPETDRRRRVLHAAIIRRDEVLLDGLIAELD